MDIMQWNNSGEMVEVGVGTHWILKMHGMEIGTKRDEDRTIGERVGTREDGGKGEDTREDGNRVGNNDVGGNIMGAGNRTIVGDIEEMWCGMEKMEDAKTNRAGTDHGAERVLKGPLCP